MPISAATASALASPLFRRNPPAVAPPLLRSRSAAVLAAGTPASRRRSACRVALTSSASSQPAAKEKPGTVAKAGKRLRVKVPLRVHHVARAPQLDLNGIEGIITQYVGAWKRKRISANLPFKAEFEIAVEGQPRPVKFFAHLKEDEFEQ